MKGRKSTIPEMGPDQITLEHCSMLKPKLSVVLQLMGGDRAFGEVADAIEVDEMLEEFEQQFTPEEFCRLFQTEIGKGVILAIMASRMISELAEQFAESEY